MEIVQPSGSGSSGSPLTVTDGVTSVLNVTTIDFASNATVTDAGGGTAEVAITGGSGTVTDVSVVTANGVSGSVATSTTTPAITLDISSLDATKIADGTVTSAEFQYLGGVTSDIQTQLNNKLNGTQFSGLAKISVGTTEPVGPTTGDLWVDTN